MTSGAKLRQEDSSGLRWNAGEKTESEQYFSQGRLVFLPQPQLPPAAPHLLLLFGFALGKERWCAWCVCMSVCAAWQGVEIKKPCLTAPQEYSWVPSPHHPSPLKDRTRPTEASPVGFIHSVALDHSTELTNYHPSPQLGNLQIPVFLFPGKRYTPLHQMGKQFLKDSSRSRPVEVEKGHLGP